jgi:copper chaperone
VPKAAAHCDGAVRSGAKELRNLVGVTDVAVDLVPGGTSHVRIISSEALNLTDVASVIDEAGYAQVASPLIANGVPRELGLTTVASTAAGSVDRPVGWLPNQERQRTTGAGI